MIEDLLDEGGVSHIEREVLDQAQGDAEDGINLRVVGLRPGCRRAG